MAEIADYYGISDLHVFPSLADCWGLVVNEAMLCGVPSLCSIHAGCSDDLIVDGNDGLLFDPTSATTAIAQLSDALTRGDLATLGSAAEATGEKFTIERLARGIQSAVEAGIADRSGRTAKDSAKRNRS